MQAMLVHNILFMYAHIKVIQLRLIARRRQGYQEIETLYWFWKMMLYLLTQIIINSTGLKHSS